MKSLFSASYTSRIVIAIFVSILYFVNIGLTVQHENHSAHQTEKTDALNVTLHTEPEEITAGEQATLMFNLTDKMGEPFTDLMIHHDRVLHVLIVGKNLQILGHIHPEDFDERDMMTELEGTYTVHFTFPAAGRYILALDVMTIDAEYSKYLYIDVAGEKRMTDLSEDFSREKTVNGYTEEGGDRYTKAVLTDGKGTSTYQVKMNVQDKIRVGEMVHIDYHFSQAGKPITDLVPFLDAPMHFAIVNSELDGIVHTHGSVMMNMDHSKMKKDISHKGHKMEKEEPTTGHKHQGSTPDKFGPTVMLVTTFTKPGIYQIFGQLKHKDQILFPTFMVKVEE